MGCIPGFFWTTVMESKRGVIYGVDFIVGTLELVSCVSKQLCDDDGY